MRSLITCCALAFVAGLANEAPAQPATICRPTDTQAVNMIRYMRELATASLPSDSESVGIRMDYKLPAASASQVLLVQNERTCKSALQSYIGALPASTPKPTRVYVVAVGNTFVVWDALASAFEWTPHVILSSKYVVLTKFAG